MGAVLEKCVDPMLVMEYMEHGSLYDILHNETMPLDADMLTPILQDIVQGVRFLHSATPKVIHGDLKAKVCLGAISSIRCLSPHGPPSSPIFCSFLYI